MTSEILIILAVLVPLLVAVLIPMADTRENVREAITIVGSLITCAIVMTLLGRVFAGEQPSTGAFEVALGLELGLSIEPLGMLFAAVASTLWIVNSIYSIGYMRGNNEPRQTPFYICFAVAISSAIAVAFAANLFTLFLAYEALTLSTYPLVTHKASKEAMSAGRLYLLLLLGTSTILLLPAILWVWHLAGTVAFTPGGVLSSTAGPLTIGILLAMFVFGIGKAAVMPVHFWLPAAMVAPTPVSALLHAVAVVKAGVFAIMKISVYIFGLDVLAASGQNEWFIYIAAISILLGSLIAMGKDNLKARLAYSTVSQLAYVVLGAMLATSWGVLGGSMHIAMHAAGKITLFFCAGAIYVAAKKTEVSQLDGLGRTMPFTFLAFLVGALSIIGLPPFGGLWSKWFLALGALDAGQLLILAVLMISSLLNVIYLLPIPMRAFFWPAREDAAERSTISPRLKEAPVACLIAMGLTSAACILLFFFAGSLHELLQPITIP